MIVNDDISGSLNEQQLIMLRLLKKPLPEEGFQQMRNLAVKLLAGKLDNIIEEWEDKNGISEEHYDKLSNDHFRSKNK